MAHTETQGIFNKPFEAKNAICYLWLKDSNHEKYFCFHRQSA